MAYVIQRLDGWGGFVTKPGSASSYTKRLQEARVFVTRESAECERCVENEIVRSVEEVMR